MASSNRREQTHVVTKTVKTMGPDGKMHTQTVKEETKVIRKGGEMTTTTTTTTDGGPKSKYGSAQSKKPFFGGLFKKNEHKTEEETKVIQKGGEMTRITTTTTDGGPKTKDVSTKSKKPFLGGLFKKKEHKTKEETKMTQRGWETVTATTRTEGEPKTKYGSTKSTKKPFLGGLFKKKEHKTKEDTKVIRKGGETTTATTTMTDGGPKSEYRSAQSKKPFFGSLFKKKEHKTTPQSRNKEFGDRTAQLSMYSNAQGSSGTAGKGKVSLGEFRKCSLDIHNRYRAMHGAKPLKLNSELNKYAQEWAERMAKAGTFSHRPDHKYGENIYYAMNKGISAEDAVSSWYNEVKLYNFSNPGFRSGTGHFTQVAWKGSHELGIGMAEGKPGHIYVVCNYKPAGNVQGGFRFNVSPPQKSVC